MNRHFQAKLIEYQHLHVIKLVILSGGVSASIFLHMARKKTHVTLTYILILKSECPFRLSVQNEMSVKENE